MSTPVDLLLDAAWVLPIAPVNQVLADHTVAVADGRILALGPRERMHTDYAGARHLSLPHHVLLPGLVNAHGHAAMALLRGVADDVPLDTWLNERIWPLEARWVTPEFVTDGASLAIAEMLKSGTTCFADMYFHPEATVACAQRAGIRAQVCFPVIRFANGWSTGPEDALHKGMALIDRHRDDPRVRIGFGPHSVYAVDRDTLVSIAMFAEELDAPVHIHLHETASEVDDAGRTWGKSPIELLHEIGFLGPRVQAVHLNNVTESELGLLATSGTGAVHCPQSGLKLGSGLCPVKRLVARGIPWALGTDGAASNNGLDLFQEARVAALLANGVTKDPKNGPTLDALAVLRAATWGGARVLGLDQEIGSLEPGKRADLVAVDLDQVGTLPVHHAASQLVYTASGAHVTHVWVDGHPLVEDRRLTTLDEAEIKRAAHRWERRIAGATS